MQRLREAPWYPHIARLANASLRPLQLPHSTAPPRTLPSTTKLLRPTRCTSITRNTTVPSPLNPPLLPAVKRPTRPQPTLFKTSSPKRKPIPHKRRTTRKPVKSTGTALVSAVWPTDHAARISRLHSRALSTRQRSQRVLTASTSLGRCKRASRSTLMFTAKVSWTHESR
jgi:hypothetical protein